MLERVRERPGCGPLGLLELGDLGSEVRDEHVQVTAGAERPSEPLQLGSQRLRPLAVEHGPRRSEHGASAPGRDAQAVDALAVEVEPNADVVAENLFVLPREHRAQPADRILRRAVALCERLDDIAVDVLRLEAELVDRVQHLDLVLATVRVDPQAQDPLGLFRPQQRGEGSRKPVRRRRRTSRLLEP